ncbi:ArfGap-domain-containing protein [Schizopora paradoxa]|uniref:ArfGap-domain-containing protein n=1 Tax=Schizopora paradoxa TaxID=27342 RepID=A0A0H2S1C2_9AGAM|nr:ArfGap-domain-containing protein [Schizopora paradoxa]
MSGVSKLAAERHQRQLEELLTQPGNDVCADCKSKSPRWASHNLGIFICMRCAGLHRKLGTHISKVKSLSLDSWTKEQVESMRKMGNIKSNQIWNPDERKHPLPDNMEESERDSEMEKFIRSKYQFGRFKSKSSIVESYLGPSQSKASLPPRSQTAPIRSGSSPRPPSVASTDIPPPPVGQQKSYLTTASVAPTAVSSAVPQPRASSFSASSTLPPTSLSSPQRTTTLPFNSTVSPSQPAIPANQQASLSSSTFNDLISIQGPSAASSLPLQYQNTSSPANPYSSLSPPGGLPSSIGIDRSPAFRSASLPTGPSYGQQLTPMGGTPGTSSAFNPFFQQQQQPQQPQMQFQTQPFNSITPTISPISGPSPYNPFSQPFQQQAQVASPPPDFGQNMSMGGISPVAPQPQMFSMASNGFQPTPSTTPFGMSSPINGVQPFQQTPSPSFTMMQQQQAQAPPQMQIPWQQQQFQGSSHLSQQAQQAQQLFKSMAGGNDGSGRNPFAFS